MKLSKIRLSQGFYPLANKDYFEAGESCALTRLDNGDVLVKFGAMKPHIIPHKFLQFSEVAEEPRKQYPQPQRVPVERK